MASRSSIFLPTRTTLIALSHLRRDAILKRSLQLHPLERSLVILIAAHLSFLPWALGNLHVWSQWVSLGIAAVTFILAVAPRNYRGDLAEDGRPFRLIHWPRLLRFPLFWIGGTFLAYILVQALNPAWRYEHTTEAWWLRRIPHLTYLPHGMETPFALANPWRSLLIYGSTWLTVCSLWVGITRRKSLRIIFETLAVNAFILALVGLAERGDHADKILWFWHPPASYFVSTFTYKNHAGCYFNLLLSLCAGLTLWHHLRSRRRMAKSSPSLLYGFFVGILALMVVFSYSRAATILMLAYLAAAVTTILILHVFSSGTFRQNLGTLAVLCFLFGASALFALRVLPTDEAITRMDQLIQSYEAATPSARRLATQATLDLYRAQPVFGWGASSLRYAFPIYQRNYPGIFIDHGQRLYWEHAHDDYAEFLAEFGTIGCSILAAGFLSVVLALAKARFWRNPLAVLVGAGCVVTLIHCTGDFNFYNPAILTTWCFLAVAVIRWTEIENAAVTTPG